jgi:hypothetical protein
MAHLSADLNLNFLFVSGGQSVPAESLDLGVPSLGERRLEPRTVYDALADEAKDGHVIKALRRVLSRFYERTDRTKLRDATVEARRKELSRYTSPSGDKPKDSRRRPNSALIRAYCHSEQAFLMLLFKHPEILAPLLTALPPGATIHQPIFKYASLKQMCRQCATVLFVGSERGGLLRTVLETYIRGLGFSIREAGLSIFAQVSALSPFDPLDAESRGVQLLKAGEIISDSLAFVPHVAQRHVPPRRGRDGSCKPRSSAHLSVARALDVSADG